MKIWVNSHKKKKSGKDFYLLKTKAEISLREKKHFKPTTLYIYSRVSGEKLYKTLQND